MHDDKPTGRRDRKKQQTRQALIEAALQLVDERGLDHVTVEEIAEAADVSPRTFFNYFTSKDEAIAGDQLVDPRDLCTRFLAVEPNVPPVPALLLALEPELTVMQQDRALWLLRMRVMEANPALITGLIARSAAAESDLADAVAQRLGLERGHPFAAVFAAATGGAMRTAMMRWAAAGTDRPLTDLAREAFDILATGLADPHLPRGNR
ncbi:TetR/AcrR family transcriptional regulator [Actinoplanes sp. N902-109]|uniref:TetR/AcrR family transcriptional regulator n=1 Tax=Actinoplanes sp. (strain N902-109) TaxID=649831 RepID=UPI00032955BD|nr:TetR family transcriptional regulator [Actinoplanes sp. N902-109]AGL20633.1 regulatory protein TetR [Actinoplanes sp. N902-109]